ncbi:MAG: phosphatidylserine decarboxylase [Treponema sp.]|nr:phosphatidylserine decarboxylase [Treponema sp.]MCL2191432.1 phosphatidylserine decarboxylase [Treponema sp.]
MHIPITRYGLPQVLVYPALTLALTVALLVFVPPGIPLVLLTIVLALVLVWMLAFFRDPKREIPLDELVLLSPADGTITDIVETEHPGLGGKALRIGMFLSIFNVHVNRMPCSARVDAVTYKKGKFKNAMAKDSGQVNESNEVLMTRLTEPRDRLLVRQVSGAIARHIVCKATLGAEYAQGEKFGMIKFGSRTELYVPLGGGGISERYDIAVKIGDKVNAGLSPLVVYKQV